MIGLSVSMCFRDMATGQVDSSIVTKIIAGTHCVTPSDWEGVIFEYREIYWRNCADRAESLLREFLIDGKIEQPRLEGRKSVQGCNVWVNSEEELRKKHPYMFT